MQLTYFPFYADTAERYRKLLSDEQMGRLFFSAMDYLKTGEPEEVSDDIRWPYYELTEKIDAAQRAYEKKCEKLRVNGKKGATAKANKATQLAVAPSTDSTAAEKQQVVRFVPPTKKQFLEMSYTVVDAEKGKSDTEIEAEVAAFYCQLRDSGWQFFDIPITCSETLKDLLYERFILAPDWVKDRDEYKLLHYQAFLAVFRAAGGDGNRDDDDARYEVETRLVDDWKENGQERVWYIGGKRYTNICPAAVAAWKEYHEHEHDA